MIDADPQPSLSSYYKILEKAQGGLTEILIDPQNVNNIKIEKTLMTLFFLHALHFH
jgi:cellulose biosynthesis protein BcsQ